jgi:hypothetical protein
VTLIKLEEDEGERDKLTRNVTSIEKSSVTDCILIPIKKAQKKRQDTIDSLLRD